ncbi:hypothetical protein SNEBB_001885 [Seison nebaliae]|nr:hypothetical protein SNEBB_001885 [Seison nebaliae]
MLLNEIGVALPIYKLRGKGSLSINGKTVPKNLMFLNYDEFHSSTPANSISATSINTKRSSSSSIRPKSVTVAFSQTLPPKSVTVIKCKTKGIPTGHEILFETGSNQEIFSALPGVSIIDNGFVHIPISNETALDIALPRNLYIGKATPISLSNIYHATSASTCIKPENSSEDRLTKLMDVLEANESSNPNLSDIKQLVSDYEDVFALSHEAPGRMRGYEVTLRFNDAKFQQKHLYPIPHKHRDSAEAQLQSMKANNVIERSYSRFANPLVCVKKKDGSIRLCLDLTAANKLILSDAEKIPVISDILNNLDGFNMFTSLDLLSGYHQLVLSPESRDLLSFPTTQGLYRPVCLPFGVKTATQEFSRAMYIIFGNLLGKLLEVYIDDLLSKSKSKEEHIEHLRLILDRLRLYGLKIKLEKCKFFRQDLEYLGYLITPEGIKPTSEKISAIKNAIRPNSHKTLESFIGLASYYRRFFASFSEHVKPLNDIRKNASFNFKTDWNDAHERAFNYVKDKLSSQSLLIFPDYSKPFVLQTDASDVALSAILFQEKDNMLRPIEYLSRSFSKSERNYCVLDKELLAIVFACKKWRPYILGYKVHLKCDHKPLQYILAKGEKTGRLARWLLILQEFDLDFQHIPGKMNFAADALSRMAPPSLSQRECLGGIAATVAKNEPLLEWDIEDLITKQRRHPIWGEAIDSIIEKRQCKVKLPFAIDRLIIGDDKVLCEVDTSSKRDLLIKPILVDDFIQKALLIHHDHNLAAHPGIKLTWHALRNKYFFLNMSDIITKYIAQCKICNVRKAFVVPKAPIRKWPEVSFPFQRVIIDLLGPLKPSSNGFKYCLTVVDTFTRYVELIPLRNKTAPHVARALVEKVMLRHSPCTQLVSDFGTEFNNALLTEICNLLGIDRRYGVAYHPSSLGIVESRNKTIAKILRSLIEDNPKVWSDALPYVAYAMNTSFQEAIQDTPFFCLYLRDPKTPIDLLYDPNYEEMNVTDYKDVMLQRMSYAYDLVQNALKTRFDIMSKNRDETHKLRTFKEADRVFIQAVPKPGISPKLQRTFCGPYRIVEKISPVVMKAKNLRTGRLTVTHIDRMRHETSADSVNWNKSKSTSKSKYIAMPNDNETSYNTRSKAAMHSTNST